MLGVTAGHWDPGAENGCWVLALGAEHHCWVLCFWAVGSECCPSALRPSRASPRPWCSSLPSSPPSSAASCAPAVICTNGGSISAPPCKALRSHWPAILHPHLPLSLWTPKLAQCPPSPASPPWPCTHPPLLPPSTRCTPQDHQSTTPQHHHPTSPHSPAIPVPEPPWGPFSQWGHP